MNMDWLLHARAEALHRAADRAGTTGRTERELALRERESAVRWESGRRWAARREAAQARTVPAPARTGRSPR